jgi:hypothetical protein
LAELAEMGLSLARDLHARALAATDDKAAADLTLAFHRVSRSVRQTYALEARLERERRLALREAANEAARERLDRIQKKRSVVSRAVAPLVWTEAEGEEAEDLLDEIGSLVYVISEEDDFLDAPVEACVERIAKDLGLAARAANDRTGEPPPEASGEEPLDVVIWRSSS